MRILITGGAGFIGSALVRRACADPANLVTTIDKLTYAGNIESLAGEMTRANHRFHQVDITDHASVSGIFDECQPDVVFHLAAESHVDRSIDNPRVFIDTNIVGTFVLLQSALAYVRSAPSSQASEFRFVHVSTDEVFGSLGINGAFTEATPYDPSSPYSASKAASDHLVRAWNRTYGLPTIVTNCSNNYGPYQFPEKLIPHMIVRALAGESLPVYGAGENIRDWLYVDDHAAALQSIAARGEPGQTYLISGNNEWRNIDLVRELCRLLDTRRPRDDGKSYAEQIVFVADRPGHDFRYAIDASKLQTELGWRPSHDIQHGLRATVDWYLGNTEWWQRILSGEYRAARVGLGVSA